jgi:hypothetical protein
VLHNARHHGLRLLGIDPFSSGRWFDGWRESWLAFGDAPVATARTWLLQRAGDGTAGSGPSHLDARAHEAHPGFLSSRALTQDARGRPARAEPPLFDESGARAQPFRSMKAGAGRASRSMKAGARAQSYSFDERQRGPSLPRSMKECRDGSGRRRNAGEAPAAGRELRLVPHATGCCSSRGRTVRPRSCAARCCSRCSC